MKVSAYLSVGDWTKSIDVEYQSESETDCTQANTHISRVFQGPKNDTIKITLDTEEFKKGIYDVLDGLSGDFDE